MPGPPDRFELSVWERLNPVIMAIGLRVQRAEERREAMVRGLRGLTPEESEALNAGWAKVRDEYRAAQQCLLDALEHLNEAAQAYYVAKKLKRPRSER